MLRPALIALLALLLAAPTALADATRNKILRECQTGRLTGDYTAREIRDARNNIPDDLDQYTDCRDVLTRALLSRARRRLGLGRRRRPAAAGGGTGGGERRAAPADPVDRRRPAGARAGRRRGRGAGRTSPAAPSRRASRPSATTCRPRCSSCWRCSPRRPSPASRRSCAGALPRSPPSDVSSLADPVSRPQRRTITIPLPRIAGNGMLASRHRAWRSPRRRSRPPAACGSSARPTS